MNTTKMNTKINVKINTNINNNMIIILLLQPYNRSTNSSENNIQVQSPSKNISDSEYLYIRNILESSSEHNIDNSKLIYNNINSSDSINSI